MLKAIWDASVNPSYDAPALNFEKATGIEGVGRVYKMPGGISMQYMESLIPGYEFSAFLMKPVIPFDEKVRFAWGMAAEGLAPVTMHTGDRARLLTDKLCDLNPALEQVRFDRTDQSLCLHFIVGVTSGFNPSDLQFYLDEKLKNDLDEAMAYRRTGPKGQLDTRCDEIFGKDSCMVQWVPSPETMAHINRELDNRYGSDSLAALPEAQRRQVLAAAADERYGPDQDVSALEKIKAKINAALSAPRIFS